MNANTTPRHEIPLFVIETIAHHAEQHLPNDPAAFHRALADTDPPRFQSISATECETLVRRASTPPAPTPSQFAHRLVRLHTSTDDWTDPVSHPR